MFASLAALAPPSPPRSAARSHPGPQSSPLAAVEYQYRQFVPVIINLPIGGTGDVRSGLRPAFDAFIRRVLVSGDALSACDCSDGFVVISSLCNVDNLPAEGLVLDAMGGSAHSVPGASDSRLSLRAVLEVRRFCYRNTNDRCTLTCL
ncbi:MAG: hypothetical protein P4L40_19105 [Terracidiphilus sp.]|nr:hypothetical protein [Terracidiphilus sp.]